MKKKKLEHRILAEGETTNHAHRVEVDVYEREDGVRTFEGPTPLTHEAHGPITLPAKKLASGRVVEYDYFLEMERDVRD